MPAHSKRTPEMVEAILEGRAEIYGLYDPRDGALRYIGKANNSAKRLASHKRDANRRDTPVYRWFRKLAASDMAPSVTVLCKTDEWETAERRLIAEHRAAGARLLNVAEGGEEPYCSPEVRAANGKKLSERLKSDPAFKAMRDAKREVGLGLSKGWIMNVTREKLRECARLDPRNFGAWASIPDRLENADGSPVTRNA